MADDDLAGTEDECEICAGDSDVDMDCSSCEGSGDDEWSPDGDCRDCGGSGQRTPEHCCNCGGMPYCHCKDTGTDPVEVRLHDGTTKVID